MQIRAEKDIKKINKMTKQEKEIRNKWTMFKNNQQAKISLSNNEIDAIFSKIFK